VTPDLIERLLEPFNVRRWCGIAQRSVPQPDVIQYAGYSSLNPFYRAGSGIGDIEPDRGQFDRPGPTPFCTRGGYAGETEVIDRAGHDA
jgi:hypothetical protein